jgi:RimK-like ATP-grasp domain
VVTLLWGLESDEPLAMVHEALQEFGAEVLLLDQRRTLDTEFRLIDERTLTGSIRYGSRVVQLDHINACYLRPYDARRVPAIQHAGPQSADWAHALALEDALLGWLEVTEARVINRPSAMLPNGSKPYQLQLVAASQFSIPETLVTTDPLEVIAFCECHELVVYKSVSGVRSRVARLDANARQRIADVAHCPTQFQAYIPGRDYRAHVVGEQVFACEVRSQADDYRYGSDNSLSISATRLSREVEERCVLMTNTMALEVAGIDLRCTPKGEWYCFEVNPSPGFSFYEQFCGQGVANAIASLLASPKNGRSSGRSAFTFRASRNANPQTFGLR